MRDEHIQRTHYIHNGMDGHVECVMQQGQRERGADRGRCVSVVVFCECVREACEQTQSSIAIC